MAWGEIAHQVRTLAAALIRCGVSPGDRVVQLSENSDRWIIADLAIQMAQAVHVALDARLSGQQAAEQISGSDARVVIVSTPAQACKLAHFADQLAVDIHWVSHQHCPQQIGRSSISWLDPLLVRVSKQEADRAQQQALSRLGPESLATIIYTSGTTGRSKGITLSQRNLVWNATATVAAHQRGPGDLQLCILPLSHVFARTCDLYTWIVQGSQLALAESRETVLADCRQVRPTVINGVPYFYQRVYRQWQQDGCSCSLPDLLGGRVRECCCGGAPLSGELSDAFEQQGVLLLPGYGLTEASPVVAVSTPGQYKRGTVGRPIPGVQVRIAGDGELLTRGPHVMVGVWNDDAATRQVIRDGWLHTGDIAHLDEDGFVTITGRKKELIVMAVGTKVVPTHVEQLLCRDPLIQQAMVVGEGRNYLAALIVPDWDRLRAELAAGHLSAVDPEANWDGAVLGSTAVRQLYRDRISHQLSGVAHHQQVRQFTLLGRSFSAEQGELTPKMSLRRKEIEAHFAREIKAMYE